MRRAKVDALRARRLMAWATKPERFPRPEIAPADAFAHVHHRSVLSLATGGDPDPVLAAGKRRNLAIAAPHFDGRVLSPERPLSFWRILGRPTPQRGFAYGMELRGGCIVPAVGGGLCMLSNALFRMACELGWTILERHGHTMDAVLPASDALWGVDATVFWPYVDLRIAPSLGEGRLGVAVRDGTLVLEVRGRAPATAAATLRETACATAGGYRENHIDRTIYDVRTGAVIGRDQVARNRKRLVTVDGRRRTCLSCEELGCHARPRDLPGG